MEIRPLFGDVVKTDPTMCPRCHSTIVSATGIFAVRGPIVPVQDALTLCDQCSTWLVFDAHVFPAPTLALRLATTEEIDRIDPDMRAVAENIAAVSAMRRRSS